LPRRAGAQPAGLSAGRCGRVMTRRQYLLVAVLLSGASALYLYLYPAALTGLQRSGDAAGITPPPARRVYTWKDGEGQMHVSDQPPPRGVDYDTRIYRDDLNVVPHLSEPHSE
jgi:hypothetical protein